MNSTCLVLGASDKPERTSFQAIQRLTTKGIAVRAVGKRDGHVGEVQIEKEAPALSPGSIDTVTLYLNAVNQRAYYDYILQPMPRRIIFNPGAENAELMALAGEKGIDCEEACTLVLLASGLY